jgi:DNA-binding transcriptional MerR regulator
MRGERSWSAVRPAERDVYTIGEMARHFGVTLRALRFYEDKGLIKSMREGPTRYYDAQTRARLQRILKGKQLGFTLTEIRDLLDSKSQAASSTFELALDEDQILEQIDMLKRQRESIEQAINELQQTHRQLSNDHSPSPTHAAQHAAS